MNTLTKDERAALRAVKDGGDVYDRGIAVILRACEKRGLVTIVKPVMPQSGKARQPYFGAITTRAGLRAIAKVEGK